MFILYIYNVYIIYIYYRYLYAHVCGEREGEAGPESWGGRGKQDQTHWQSLNIFRPFRPIGTATSGVNPAPSPAETHFQLEQVDFRFRFFGQLDSDTLGRNFNSALVAPAADSCPSLA